MTHLPLLLAQIVVVLLVTRGVGSVFARIGQPRVVGEMFAGIMLGPSLLGWIAPHFSAYLFPASSLGFLNALSQIGVIVFMFLVGLKINPSELKKESHAAVLASHVSITAPFVLAAFLIISVLLGWRIVFEWTSRQMGPRERLLLVGTSDAARTAAEPSRPTGRQSRSGSSWPSSACPCSTRAAMCMSVAASTPTDA